MKDSLQQKDAALPDIKVFVDCADPEGIRRALTLPWTRGITTNPSLVSQLGIASYTDYARQVLEITGDSIPISFEVLSESPEEMEKEARAIHSWGHSIYVKVPVIDASGHSMAGLIHELSSQGIPLNVTCVFTTEQADIAARSLSPGVPSLVSVFAGRIADVGVNPLPILRHARIALDKLPETELLWASTREVYSIWQAADVGCDIITAPLSMVEKLTNAGMDLHELSCKGVAAFMDDIAASNLRF